MKNYDALIITAGAGMGVDSGLPDFRGNQGFWRAYPKVKNLGLSFEEMANANWFKEAPELAWAFYGHRLNLYRGIEPHNGFLELLEFGRKLPMGYGVITSNVDGHFQKSGFKNNQVLKIHGSINYGQCIEKCGIGIFDISKSEIEINEVDFEATKLPKCPNCGALARPNILMFEDFEWDHTRTGQQ